MVGWEQALDTFASRAGGALRWMLVGSSATRVQGAAVDPGDVDILVHPETSDSDLTAITAAFMPYAATHAKAMILEEQAYCTLCFSVRFFFVHFRCLNRPDSRGPDITA